MPEIRVLSPSMINKIAAGEVIERPASVVKELIENAIDSGATRIDVEVDQGGVERIRVADNGCGMEPEQLPLAVTSHATSKVSDADDLFRVSTMGFRGEALASIAEISQLLIRSRTHDAEAGAELEVNGGRASEVAPCGCGPGTIVEVRHLFHNTPVRRKYLKTTQTEFGHISEAFTRVALAHPNKHFRLLHNGREIHELPEVDNLRDRIAALFGPEISDGLIRIEQQEDELRLSGFVAEPTLSRANNRMQYLLLNGRHIRDRSQQHALSEAYRGLLLTGRYPICFLRLDMPAEWVDVNVHPTKLEVRFQDAGRIYRHLLGTLRTRFLSTDLTAKVAPASPVETIENAGPGPRDTRVPEPSSRSLWTQTPTRPAFSSPPSPAAPAPIRHDAVGSIGEQVPLEGPQEMRPAGLQLHNRYLVTEDEHGIVVIDQHALHERVLYEQLRSRILNGVLESQRLLVPEPVSLTSAEASAVLNAKDTLAQLGIEVEPFGGDTILVSAYPAMLSNLGPGEILRQAVEHLMAGEKSPDRRDLVDELLHMISCKAAVKAGDRLSADEIEALLDQRHLCQDAHHCPHGRPTSLLFTREELDKRFQRI